MSDDNDFDLYNEAYPLSVVFDQVQSPRGAIKYKRPGYGVILYQGETYLKMDVDCNQCLNTGQISDTFCSDWYSAAVMKPCPGCTFLKSDGV